MIKRKALQKPCSLKHSIKKGHVFWFRNTELISIAQGNSSAFSWLRVCSFWLLFYLIFHYYFCFYLQRLFSMVITISLQVELQKKWKYKFLFDLSIASLDIAKISHVASTDLKLKAFSRISLNFLRNSSESSWTLLRLLNWQHSPESFKRLSRVAFSEIFSNITWNPLRDFPES